MQQIKYDHIVVRFGELSTKGKNKKDFVNRLLENIRATLKDLGNLNYEKAHDRLYIYLNDTDEEVVVSRLQNVFGISSFSLAFKLEKDMEVIKAEALNIAQKTQANTFKIFTKRSDKTFHKTSDEINRDVATIILRNTNLKVDVKNPELKIYIEIRVHHAYIMSDIIKGANGYPVGVAGKAMMMLSGGIDSPVAAYLMMKRGIKIECIHFASSPYTSQQALDKVLKLAEIVAKYQGSIKVHIVPFTNLQLAIYQNAHESYCITLMRRMMYRLAQGLALKNKCLILASGESIGQVASQTLESISVINAAITMPMIRPLATFDKTEIVDLSKKIETYETSILPFEDCCTIFTPKNPVTKPKLDRVEYFETKFDYPSLIAEAIAQTETKYIHCGNNENELF